MIGTVLTLIAFLLMTLMYVRSRHLLHHFESEAITANMELRRQMQLTARIMAARVRLFPGHTQEKVIRIGDIYEGKEPNPMVYALDGYVIDIRV